MNYYQARQVDPDADRPDRGKWRYTKRNDDRIWAVGACGAGCPGHDTAEEACQHYVESQIAGGVLHSEVSWTSCVYRSAPVPAVHRAGLRCENPAHQVLTIGDAFYALCDDHAWDNVAEALYRLDHQGEFSQVASW